jgi:hypothetical protein
MQGSLGKKTYHNGIEIVWKAKTSRIHNSDQGKRGFAL